MASFTARLLLGLLGMIIAVGLLKRIRNWQRLRHIPGPFGAGILEWWHLRHTMGGRMHLDTAEACEKYGPLIRIGPNELITNDGETLKRISGVRSNYQRSDWYAGLRIHPDHDNVLSELDQGRHTELRVKMAAGGSIQYSGKENEHLEQSIDNNIANLIHLLEEKYLSDASTYKPVDFAPKAQFLTLDIITDIAFGKAFGYIDGDHDCYSYIKKAEESLGFMVLCGVFGWLIPILRSPIFRFIVPSEKDGHGLGKLMAISQKVVAERFGPDKKEKKDMLGSFIRHGLTQREAESESLMQILAGSDTTATALRATMLYILSTTHVLPSLLAEIRTHRPSHPITSSEARSMPYLQATIYEGLRHFPPTTGMFYKLVPEGGDTLLGYAVPGGAKIGWSVFGLMHDRKVWGEDAETFRPERWIAGVGASEEEVRVREGYKDMVFGLGRWQCLGRNVALLELDKVFVELFRKFEFTLVSPEKPWKSVNKGLFCQSDMWMRVSRREESL